MINSHLLVLKAIRSKMIVMVQNKIKTMEYRETEKFNRWVRCFFDVKNKETYGNATQSTLKVYNTTNYKSASVIGHENLVKLRHLSSTVADQLGYGFADLIKIGLAKMIKGSYDDWDRIMVRFGYFEPEKKISTAVQNNFDFKDLGAAINRDRIARGLKD